MTLPDISVGREPVPISCVNALNEAQPDPLLYSGVRMPQSDVKLNTNTDFMICCDCTDNCQVSACNTVRCRGIDQITARAMPVTVLE